MAPLPEFIEARNTLAARLKKSKRDEDATLVKSLPKPSLTAWAVNQLYWKHRDAYDRLITKSLNFQKLQSSRKPEKTADLRSSLEARRQALTELAELATDLLRDSGYNPSPDNMRRITANLEALSAYATLSGGPQEGRLTRDIDPPGFEALAALSLGAPKERIFEHPSHARAPQASQKMEVTIKEPRKQRSHEQRREKIAAAKTSLQEAKSSFGKARDAALRMEAAHKKALADLKSQEAKADSAETQLREAEERFKKATAALREAEHRARKASDQVERGAALLQNAKRIVDDATRSLEVLFQSGTK